MLRFDCLVKSNAVPYTFDTAYSYVKNVIILNNPGRI